MLRPLVPRHGGAEHRRSGGIAFGGDAELKRRAGIPVPDLVRIDEPVPGGALARPQEIIDRCAGAAPARAGVAVGLAIPAAFRMRSQAERGDDVFGFQAGPSFGSVDVIEERLA
jgi:hypothetical protein